MDRKGIAILVAAVAAFCAYYWAVNRFVPAPPPSAARTNALSVAAAPAVPDPRAARSDAGTVGVPAPRPAMLSAGAPEQKAVLENDYVRATFTSDGGGLKYVELKKYPAVIRCDGKATNSSGFASLNRPAYSPAFVFAGADSFFGDGRFEVTERGGVVRASKELPSGLRIVKTFALTNNYEMTVTVRMENGSGRPESLPAHEFVVGTASPMESHELAASQGVYWYNGSKARHIDPSWFANKAFFGCVPGTPRREFRDGESNVVWTAVHNRFFAMFAAPETPAASLVVWDYPLPEPRREQVEADGRLDPHPHAHQAALVYPASSIPAGQAVERRYRVYAGPKEYFSLSRIEPEYDLVMDFTGITGFCAKALLLSLNGLHNFIPSYGWCIVAVTVLVKLLFWPLTAAGARAQRKMQAIQPELQALKEKYKDNPRKMQEKNAELMKKHGISLPLTCVGPLLQLPVLIGFVAMVGKAIELRGEHFGWACDLSQPDTLFVIPGLGFVPMIGIQGVGLPFNLFPLLMVSTSLWLSHLMPPSPQMDPAQQKMMRYMPVFFVVFFYNYSSGLTLYWTVQNLLSVLQTKIARSRDDKKPTPPAPTAARPAARR